MMHLTIHRAASRRRIAASLVVALAVGLVGAPAVHAARDRGDVRIVFDKVQPANRAAVAALRRSGAPAQVARAINARYALPRDLRIFIGDDAPRQVLDNGPAYYASIRAIAIPGGFVTQLRGALTQLVSGVDGLSADRATASAMEFILLHEIGHAFVHQFRIPIAGREEDAVDGFAAFATVRTPSFGPLAAVSAALFFAALGQSRGELAPDFTDVHSTPEQRTYQFLCWVYGSNPREFRSLVADDALPRDRAAGCPGEWRQANFAWTTLLRPFRKR